MAANSQGNRASQGQILQGRILNTVHSHQAPIDYSHRHFVNLAATIVLLTLALASMWTIKAIDNQEKLQRCFNSGRKDCIPVAAPPRGMVQLVR
ncbi:hypothetical protein PY365_33670 [Roseiarcaceae bacterium H3SJ34-1]|uniref:hypothetical protein n=1 Tax=Terripilifer ovatus TaxID=3032367 RepID=UPI003AB92210|nr:hypothetical protein [Roseiarcaceae bacterium H3SJ34-1]